MYSLKTVLKTDKGHYNVMHIHYTMVSDLHNILLHRLALDNLSSLQAHLYWTWQTGRLAPLDNLSSLQYWTWQTGRLALDNLSSLQADLRQICRLADFRVINLH